MKKSILLVLLLLSISSLFSQIKDSKLKLFISCNFCDVSYLKQNIEHAEFMRDQNFADVHLLFRSQRNGSGGRVFEIDFIGQNDFKEIQDKMSFSTNSDNTRDETRVLMLKNIKLGLVRYWVKAGLQDKISIVVKKAETNEDMVVKDPWNMWVFGLGARGFFNGQETYSSRSLNFNVSAKRVSEKNKFYARISYNDNKSVYEFNDAEIISKNNSKHFSMSDVISINSHWSAGFFTSFGASNYSNKDLYFSFLPAIEYNFFSYKASFKKQLTLGYRIGGNLTNYIETTVYGKDEEFLWNHKLSLAGSVKQTWGNINGSIDYESYLHDVSLNQFSFSIGTNLRLFKGFSMNLDGFYSITNNQINLPAGDLTLEELLLRQQQLKSGFNYFFSVGFRYTFGSIYNTVVNPRFSL